MDQVKRRTMKRKRLFSKAGTRNETVLLNWQGTPEEEFTLYAEAYHKVANEAVKALKNNQDAGFDKVPLDDFRAYPIVFLYRHSLELYMKAVILVAAPMLMLKSHTEIDRKKLLNTHSLDTLRKQLEQVFAVYEWEWDLGTAHFKTLSDFRNIISELHEVDTHSFVFRYPLDTKGKASLSSNFEFNLFRFCEILDSLLPVLESVAFAAYEQLQLEYEIMSEFNKDIYP
jgi:hypothetical protein